MFASTGPHVSLVAEPLFQIGPITITNSSLLGLVGIILLFSLFAYTLAKTKSGHHSRLSIAVLWGFEMLLGTAEEIIGSREKARKLAPLAITLFFLIIINNWLEILPFVGPVTWNDQPLFRGLAADLNFTFAIAIITMITAQIWAIKTHGIVGNLGRYIANPFTNPMGFFEGLLDIVAELSRLIALSMRLFGNIFGGEVLLIVITFISAWAAPIAVLPFMLLELFVGAIQAYIFFMLTVVFVSLGTASHGEPEAEPALVEAGS